MTQTPYNALAQELRRRFGCRVQKIPLDAGFSCPNRDGTLSRSGCLFCNPQGSGSGLGHLDLAAQWQHWRERYLRKFSNPLFIAYLQSFSNTHGPTEKLAGIIDEIKCLPDLVGLSVGTRPDCLADDKLKLLAGLNLPLVWLELGLQSADNAVLARSNRGHDLACFQRACHQAAEHGLGVCAHLMAGLPGEELAGFLRSVQVLNELPVQGVKFHNVYVCRHTGLAALWQRGDYTPLPRAEYVRWIGEALSLLRPDIVVHRLTGDPAEGELLAPDWAADKRGLLDALHSHFQAANTLQGRCCPTVSTTASGEKA